MSKKLSLDEKFFVAGSSGMVGSSVCKLLKNKGYGLKEFGGDLFMPKRKDLNLFNYEDVNSWFKHYKPTVVILAAAKVGGILANSEFPYDFLLENLKIQNNVIEASWKNNVKRFLFLGSSCIYPKYANQPIREESLLDGELEKTNECYALAKISGIKLCEALRIQYGFDAISLMPTNLYGPKDNYHPSNSHVMASLIRKFSEAKIHNKKNVTCWGTGDPLREFMHVQDLADAIIFCLENWDPENKNAPKNDAGKPLYFLNVGTGKDISIKELVKKIANEVGFDGEVIWDQSKPDGTPKKQLDVSRINKLGWHSKINLDEGIRKTIKEFTSY
nr:GDP-L-fucose synthase [Prochlorococcus marinus]